MFVLRVFSYYEIAFLLSTMDRGNDSLTCTLHLEFSTKAEKHQIAGRFFEPTSNFWFNNYCLTYNEALPTSLYSLY